MIYYFLPDPGRFGGVKVGCQFVEMLVSLGVRAAVALPDGRAPRWFSCSAPVVEDRVATAALTDDDWAVLTWPPDHARLASLPGRRLAHVQGTDPRMDAIFADPDVVLVTCWEQATRYAREHHGRSPIELGISVSDVFFAEGERAAANRVAYMPRRGYSTARRCMRASPDLDFVPVDEEDEIAVAAILRRSGFFLATAEGEQFGLPALEAMAAGCVVASVPVKGGMEYLQHGVNCLVDQPERLAGVLHGVSRPGRHSERSRLRAAARATAARYRHGIVRGRLARLLDGPLRELAA